MAGREFWKLSGSGNDFVVFDVRAEPASIVELGRAEVVRELCARGTGVGADGVVLIAPPDEHVPVAGEGAGDTGARGSVDPAAFRMIYFNSDGSRGEMCGNAALCSTMLAAHLGIAPASGMCFQTDSGLVNSRMVGESSPSPEIDLAPVHEVVADFAAGLEPGERRMGFASVGVPHLVVLCDDVEMVDVMRRGAELRHHGSLAAGANVNFVSRGSGGGGGGAGTAGWQIRTYERGVEGETLACGTGATAASILLATWGEADGVREPVSLTARSGLTLEATPGAGGHPWRPSLRGSARIVYRARLGG